MIALARWIQALLDRCVSVSDDLQEAEAAGVPGESVRSIIHRLVWLILI